VYASYLKLWPNFGHGLHPDGVTAAIIAARQAGLSPVTVNAYLRCLKAFWNWLHKRGVLAEVPEVRCLPEPRKVKAVFSSSQASAVLKAKPTVRGVKRAQALFAVAVDTGLRFGELVSICRSDIDAHSMLLTVRGKAGERRVPVSATALRWINRHLQTHTYDHVFCSRCGTMWDHANAQRKLKALFEFAGVPVELAKFHHIRRYALRQYVNVAGLRGAQLLADHASPQTTIKYLDGEAELRELPHGRMSPLVQLSGYGR
jgi:integrase/recombinase XerD